MAFTFNEFLKQRDPDVYKEVLTDLGIDLNDPEMQKSFVATLQKNKGLDLKKVASDVLANPNAKPDKAQVAADKAFQTQQDILKGKGVPAGVKSSDWETSVGLLTPTGNAIPNEIGRGKPPVDVAATLDKGMQAGGLPANAGKLAKKAAPWLNWTPSKPPVAAKPPTVDPKEKMTPADKAKAKSQPGVGVGAK